MPSRRRREDADSTVKGPKVRSVMVVTAARNCVPIATTRSRAPPHRFDGFWPIRCPSCSYNRAASCVHVMRGPSPAGHPRGVNKELPMRRLRAAFVTVALVAFLPSAAFAQASITGVVRDSSGAVLPGVTVEASSPDLIEKVRTAVSDEGGRYR